LTELVEIKTMSNASPGSMWSMTLRRLFRQSSSLLGMLLLGSLILIAIFAKQIAPYDPSEVLIGIEDVKFDTPPCIHLLGCPVSKPQHIMGTDSFTRDFYSRIIYGTRISLLIGISTIGAAVLIGIFLGAIAGYSGGWWDVGIMQVMDVMLAFPVLLLALAVITLLGPDLKNILIAITISQIPQYARITRASVLSLKETEFVEASRALGGGYFYVLLKRILPNTLTPLIVKGTLGIGSAILDAAALSFLGFGVDKHIPEWGSMLGIERNSMFNTPHLVIFPGVAIMITVLAFNLIGDGLRDALDTRFVNSKGLMAVDNS